MRFNIEVYVTCPDGDRTFKHWAVTYALLLALKRHYWEKYGENHIEYFHVFYASNRKPVPQFSFDLPDYDAGEELEYLWEHDGI